MEQTTIVFDSNQFKKLFPFYFMVNANMCITQAGPSFLKLYPDAISQKFEAVLHVKRPSIAINNFADFELLMNQTIIVENLQAEHTKVLRGQFEYNVAINAYIFIGSLWVASVTEIVNNQLSLSDFALHDATIDMLHVVKAQENVSEDLKEVLRILKAKKDQQKQEQQAFKQLSLVASLNESGVIFLNNEGRIIWSNEGFAKQTGFAKEMLEKQYFFELGKCPAEIEQLIVDMLQALSEGKTIETEFPFTKNDGTIIWCKSKAQPIPYDIVGDQQFFMIVEDITKYRKQKQQLKVLSLIAEDNINAVIIADAEGKIEWVNKSFTAMTDYTIDEIKGKKPGQFLQGELTNKDTNIFMQQQLLQGNNFTTEIINYSKSGIAYWVKIQCQPIKNAKGVITGFFAIEENITEKKLSAQRLEESEKRLGVLITNLHAGILVEDENRKIILANHLFCNLFNIKAKPESLVGTDYKDATKATNYLFKKADEFEAGITTLLAKKKLVTGDILEMTDGRFVSRDYIPIFINEIYRGHLWKYTDITTEKNAQNALQIREEKYRSIIANMNLGLVEVDKEEIIQFANNSFCLMSGYTLDELIGKNASTLFLLHENSSILTQKNESRKTGISDAYELQIKNKNGEEKWWLISGAPRFNDEGEMVGSIGIHLDISDQKKLQHQLKLAKDIAEKAQAAEQEFLANMSHEIRTPLNAIAGMTYLLQDTSVNDEQKEYVEVIQSSTEVLLRLVSNILDISKIESRKIEATFKEIDIIRLLKGLEKTIRIQHKNTAVKINFIYPQSPIQYVVSDDLMITQILLNILTNASKFTDAGEIKLTTELFSNNDDKVLLNVVISDTGKGMSKVEQQNIFEKFIQVGDEESRAKGTGLGLAITKKLVEFLKGTINVTSEEGIGTTFNILLPLKKGKSTVVIQEQIGREELQQQNFKGFTVLVAEDNEVNRKYIGKLLDKWQVDYDFAFNGQEAIDLLKKGKKYQLILMDLQMPIKDGIEATIEIRQTNSWYKNIPIIGVSATAIIALKQQARASGIDSFVSKPYTPSQLQTAMAEFLQIDIAATPIVTDKSKYAATNFEFDSQLNPELLKELINDDYEYAKVLFEIFESTILPQIDDVKKAYADNACETFSKLIHKIKPTFTMVGIPGLNELLNTLEMQSAATDTMSTCQNLYVEFLQQLDIYIPIIKNERKRLEAFLNEQGKL